MQMAETLEPEEDRQLVTTRVIDGPRHLVFRAWTEERHLARWFGPNGFKTVTRTFEFRQGGVWDFDMIGPDGTIFPNWVEWLEIATPERIHYRQGTHGEDPDSFLTTVTFADQDGRTEITLRALLKSRAQRDYLVENYRAVEGGRETLERLEAYLREVQS